MNTAEAIKGDGVQSLVVFVPGWTVPALNVMTTEREVHATLEALVDYWRRYTDRIEFQHAGYDMGVYGDYGDEIGMDGYPEVVGVWREGEHDDEIVWEVAG
jgi:hypothetical protein